MGPLRIFLSYRRDSDYLRAVIVRMIIEATFNKDQGTNTVEVFQDVRQRLGVEWPAELSRMIAESDIVLAIIGPQWLGASDVSHRRRIDQEDDWVRRELEFALGSTKTVIPIACGCGLPKKGDLPTSIQGLTDRQGVTLHENFSDNDLQPILVEIERHIQFEPIRALMPSATNVLPYPNPPLPVKPAPLDVEDISRALTEMISGWELVESTVPETGLVRMELHKDYQFGSFGQALDFMQSARAFIDATNHHPRWENLYHTLKIFLTTWDIGHRVSYLDIMLAQHLDKIFVESSAPERV